MAHIFDVSVSEMTQLWPTTNAIFARYGVPIHSEKAIKDHFTEEQLHGVVQELAIEIGRQMARRSGG